MQIRRRTVRSDHLLPAAAPTVGVTWPQGTFRPTVGLRRVVVGLAKIVQYALPTPQPIGIQWPQSIFRPTTVRIPFRRGAVQVGDNLLPVPPFIVWPNGVFRPTGLRTPFRVGLAKIGQYPLPTPQPLGIRWPASVFRPTTLRIPSRVGVVKLIAYALNNPAAPPAISLRDRDVRNAIQAAMTATCMFDAVWIWGLPEDYGSGASQLAAAAIEPSSHDQRDLWDAEGMSGIVITSRVVITLLYRHEDPQIRDEAAELLFEYTANALNGQSLAGWTIPGYTKVTSWRWEKPKAPERRITVTFSYQYIVEGWNSYDETP